MMVDFTQPYTTSGLAVVVPVKQGGRSQAWAFMRPFTPLMWVSTGVFFFFTGLVLWLLEHKKNRQWRGKPKKQVVTTLWFIFSTLFFSQRKSPQPWIRVFPYSYLEPAQSIFGFCIPDLDP